MAVERLLLPHTTTLLCEVINEEIQGLDSVLTTSLEGVNEDLVKDIENRFLVRSWDEFLDKFQPALYEVPMVDTLTNTPIIQYLQKKPEGIDAQRIEFKRDHPLMKSFLQLMERKTMDGQTNAYFDFSEALKNSFSPAKLKKEADKLKKDMLYLSMQYEQLADEDPQKDLVGDKLEEKIYNAGAFFKNKTSLTQLAQETLGQQLLALATQTEKNEGDKPLALSYASFEITENGIQAIEVPNDQKQARLGSNQVAGQQQLIGYVGSYYDEVVQAPQAQSGVIVETKGDTYQKQLVVSALTGGGLAELPVEMIPQKVEEYNYYVDLTADIMSNYFQALSELFGKITGVKQFFDEYEKNVKSKKVEPRLLVANAKLENLVQLEEFKKYLKLIHDKGYFQEHGLTSVIVPGVSVHEKAQQAAPKSNLLGRQKKAKSEATVEGVQLEDVKTLAELLLPFKIPVFFGIQGESSTFKKLSGTSFEQEFEPFLLKIKKQQGTWREVFVPCYPNATIIPSNSSLTTATKVQAAELGIEKANNKNIQVPGFYIDASYIAASFVAAHHCPGYLKEKYKEKSEQIDEALPGIRISFSEQSTKTTLPIEIKGIPESVLERINNISIGFVLMSQNSLKSEGKITVHSCNSSRVNELEKGRPLYRMLVESFVRNTLHSKYDARTETEFRDQLNEQKLNTFGRKLKTSRDAFNRIFHENESVTFEGTKTLNFSFKEEQNPIEVEIKSEN